MTATSDETRDTVNKKAAGRAGGVRRIGRLSTDRSSNPLENVDRVAPVDECRSTRTCVHIRAR